MTSLARSVDRSSTFQPHMLSVPYKLDVLVLDSVCHRQALLAALAGMDDVRLVHLALEQLYQTQLVAMNFAARLVEVAPYTCATHTIS